MVRLLLNVLKTIASAVIKGQYRVTSKVNRLPSPVKLQQVALLLLRTYNQFNRQIQTYLLPSQLLTVR